MQSLSKLLFEKGSNLFIHFDTTESLGH